MTSPAGQGIERIAESRVQLVRRALYAILLFFAAAASFNGFYTKIGFREDDPKRGFQVIVDGTAARPYIYRQLLPVAANVADRLAPARFKQKLAELRSDNGDRLYASLFSAPIALNQAYSFRYLAFYLATFFAAVLAAFVCYAVGRHEGCSPEISLLSAILLILAIPYIQTRGGGYYEDFPELALIGLAVLAARRAHWLWLLPVAFFGALNKETFILVLIALWPILRQRWGRKNSLLQVFVLEIVAGSVYLVERMRFAANPGGTVEVHIKEQLSYLAHPALWLFKFGKVYGIFVPELATIVPALLLAGIVWYGWRNLPSPIRYYAKITAAINLPLFLLFCRPGEVRDLSLLYIVVLLAVAATLSRAADARSAAPVTRAAVVEEFQNWHSAPLESGVPRA